MATTKQIRFAKLKAKELKSSQPRPDGKLMIEAGYSESISKTPCAITKTKGFQKLLAKYAPVDRCLQTIYDLSGEDNDDKDNRLKASVEGLKLNDAYPTQKKAILQLYDKVSNLFDD